MKKLEVLVPFDVLCDVDFGLIKMVLYEYSKKGFNTMYLKLHDDTLKYMLMTREQYNPLHVIKNREFEDNVYDDLYSQFINEAYDRILLYTPQSSIFNMINTVYNTNFKRDISFTVWCNNITQKQLIDKLNGYLHRFNVICAEKLEQIDFCDYDVIYVKYLQECIPIKDNLIGKNLYVLNYSFNVDRLEDGQEIIKMEYGEVLLGICVLKIINMYNIDNEYIPVG